MATTNCTVGVADHWGWAIVVVVDAAGSVLDRRKVMLLDDEKLPRCPYHHEAQRLALPAAETMIAAVTAAVERQAALLYSQLQAILPFPITCIALRKCPQLPATVAERLQDYFSQNNADSVLYREALASVALTRGWQINWYATKSVSAEAAVVLGVQDIDGYFRSVKQQLGSPWTKDHQQALAAAIAASTGMRS